jgi:CRP-like cAMP-binding protein
MHMHTAIRAASFTQPSAQAKNLPLANGRASVDVIELMGTVILFARNTEVYGENEPAEYLYKVISGTVRTYKVLVDGSGHFMTAALFSASRPARSIPSRLKRSPTAKSPSLSAAL